MPRRYLRGDAMFLVGEAEDGAPVPAVLVGLDGKVRKAQKPATEKPTEKPAAPAKTWY